MTASAVSVKALLCADWASLTDLSKAFISVTASLQISDALASGEEYGGGIPNYIIDKGRAYCVRWEDQVKKATFLRQFMQIQLVSDDMERDPSYWR